MFNKFERVDLQQNSTVEGTGLGLVITRSLLDMMNGDSLSSHRLSAGEYFFDSGVLDLYASYYEASDAIFYKRMLLESSYSSGSGGRSSS